jgi:hypothetical protein
MGSDLAGRNIRLWILALKILSALYHSRTKTGEDKE